MSLAELVLQLFDLMVVSVCEVWSAHKRQGYFITYHALAGARLSRYLDRPPSNLLKVKIQSKYIETQKLFSLDESTPEWAPKTPCLPWPTGLHTKTNIFQCV